MLWKYIVVATFLEIEKIFQATQVIKCKFSIRINKLSHKINCEKKKIKIANTIKIWQIYCNIISPINVIYEIYKTL